MKRNRERAALVGSVLTHGILVIVLWGSLTLAAQPARRPAEIASSLITPTPLEEPKPLPENEFTFVETDAPLPEVCEEEPPKEPDPFDPEDLPRLPPSIFLPPDRPVAAAGPLPLPPRAAPPPPHPAARPAAVAVAAPTGPTRLAAPAKGNPAPHYPSLAIDRGIEGTVVLMVSVDAEGRVTRIDTETSSGSSLLDREAVRTVSAWKFLPALRLGRRVACRVEVPIRFRFD